MRLRSNTRSTVDGRKDISSRHDEKYSCGYLSQKNVENFINVISWDGQMGINYYTLGKSGVGEKDLHVQYSAEGCNGHKS